MDLINKYDYLIIGTNIVESIISASLSTLGYKILNVDKNFQYSGELKTLSLKELKNFIDFEKNNEYTNYNDINLTDADGKILNLDSYINNNEFRNYNIDLQPKLIYSDSYSINQMASSDFDNYLNFTIIKDIHFYDDEYDKLIKIPFNKEEVFKNKDFSLIEKKNLFNFLNKILRIYNLFINEDNINLNSIKDFEKVIYSFNEENNEKLIKNILNENYLKLFENFGLKNEKLIKIFSYYFGLFDINYKKINLTVYEFLKKIIKYFNSMEVHSKLPFLYPIYGTGDVTQTFSRISAVFGSNFIINKESFFKVENNIDNYSVDINHKDLINKHKEKIIISNNFQKLFNFKQNKITRIKRINLIYEIENKDKFEEIFKKTPFIINVSHNIKELNNENPFIMHYFTKSSENVPKNKLYSHIDYVIDINDKIDINSFISFNLKNLENLFSCKFNLEIILSYIENCEFENVKEDNNLTILPSNYNDIDFDRDFLLSKNILEKLTNKKLDILVNKKINENYIKHNVQSEDKEFDDILDKLNNFN